MLKYPFKPFISELDQVCHMTQHAVLVHFKVSQLQFFHTFCKSRQFLWKFWDDDDEVLVEIPYSSSILSYRESFMVHFCPYRSNWFKWNFLAAQPIETILSWTIRFMIAFCYIIFIIKVIVFNVPLRFTLYWCVANFSVSYFTQ